MTRVVVARSTPGTTRAATTEHGMVRFALASLVVAVALGVAGAVVVRRAAVTAATDVARTVTEVPATPSSSPT